MCKSSMLESFSSVGMFVCCEEVLQQQHKPTGMQSADLCGFASDMLQSVYHGFKMWLTAVSGSTGLGWAEICAEISSQPVHPLDTVLMMVLQR